jgi:hypothetical protein
VANEQTLNYICDGCSLSALPHINDTNEEPPCNIPTPGSSTSWLPDQFECFKQKGLHFIHINARSILSKISDIRIMVSQSRPAVLSVSESWLDESVTNNEVKIEGYTIIRNDRQRTGGGVCMYIRSNIPFNPKDELKSENIETVWGELLLPKTKPIIVGTCYRPPKQACNTFLEHFEESMTKIGFDNETYILGDFNISYNHKNTSTFRKYNSLLSIFNFIQLIETPTRTTATSSTILDHILCNDKEWIC